MRLPPGSISIAFLDLLSGALAGVIILFVIVPKGTSYAPAELVDQGLTVDSLFVVIDSAFLGQDTLTRIDLDRLRENMSDLRLRVDSIRRSALAYRREVVRRKARQVMLEDSIRLLRQRVERASPAAAHKTRTVARPTPRPAPRSLPQREVSRVAPPGGTPASRSGGLYSRDASHSPKPANDALPDSAAIAARTTRTPSTTSQPRVAATPNPNRAAATPRDPVPGMLDPFMVDVRWAGRQDVDLLLLNRAGVVVCNDSRCNKRYAGMERSGKRDTAQYERMRVTTREANTYEVRLAIHTRFGGGRDRAPIEVSGDYYVKPDPAGPARKRSFTREVAPRQRGDDGAPGIHLGTLTITDDGDVVFNPEA